MRTREIVFGTVSVSGRLALRWLKSVFSRRGEFNSERCVAILSAEIIAAQISGQASYSRVSGLAVPNDRTAWRLRHTLRINSTLDFGRRALGLRLKPLYCLSSRASSCLDVTTSHHAARVPLGKLTVLDASAGKCRLPFALPKKTSRTHQRIC